MFSSVSKARVTFCLNLFLNSRGLIFPWQQVKIMMSALNTVVLNHLLTLNHPSVGWFKVFHCKYYTLNHPSVLDGSRFFIANDTLNHPGDTLDSLEYDISMETIASKKEGSKSCRYERFK